MHHPTDRISHTTAFVTPVVEHWLEREIAQWVHPMKDRSDTPSHHERTLYLWATSRSPWRKETQSTHFYLRLYGVGHIVKYHSDSERKEGNVLFNDALNTYYLRLCGVIHMVKDHSDCDEGLHHERTLLPRSYTSLPIVRDKTCCRHYMDYSFRLAAWVLLYVPPMWQDKIPQPTALVTPVVDHWLEGDIAQCVHHEGSIRRSIAPWANALTTEYTNWWVAKNIYVKTELY